MLYSKLIEFKNKNTLDKFLKSSYICFSDGTNMYNWFKMNKKEIIGNNEDENCLKIQKQYEEFIRINNENFMMRKKKTMVYTNKLLENAKEFSMINSSKKFDKDSNILLSDGKKAYDWFIENIKIVLYSKDEVYLIIQKQYSDMKKNKKRVIEQKDKHFFCAETKLHKFNELSNIILPSNKTSGKWFLENKEKILNSNNPVDLEISKQYDKYKLNYKLKYEFYLKKDLSKFNLSSNERFQSGALMCDWFDLMKDEILTSEFALDILIQKQYDSYLDSIKSKTLKKKFM